MPSDIQKSLSKGKKLNVGGVTLCQRLPGLSAMGRMEWQAVGGPRQVMAPVSGPSGPAPPSCPSVTLVTWDPCPACLHHAPWAEDTPSPSLNPRLRQLCEVSLKSYLEGGSLIGRGDQHWPICLQARVSRNGGAHPAFSVRWKASSWPCRRQPFGGTRKSWNSSLPHLPPARRPLCQILPRNAGVRATRDPKWVADRKCAKDQN